MRYLIAPDSYKGSLTAWQVAKAMERGIYRADPDAHVNLLPMADGGEGTVESILASVGGELINQKVTGPMGEIVEAFYGILSDGETAIIEMASASGLPLVEEHSRNPLLSTTYGTGELIKAALDRGCTKIVIGIGGSATNDGGVGMAQALGYRFYDSEGNELAFGGGYLHLLRRIDSCNRDVRLDNVEIIVACDVDIVLCGKHGASSIFGPQKGATQEMIKILDSGLDQLADVIAIEFGQGVKELKGGGAAGGLGVGLVIFAGAKIEKGIDLILELCKFDMLAKETDLVITGEGMTDFQSVMGKAPIGVAKRAKAFNLPTICLSGGLGKGYKEIYNHGIDAAFSIMRIPANLKEAFQYGEIWIEDAMESIIRLYLLKKLS